MLFLCSDTTVLCKAKIRYNRKCQVEIIKIWVLYDVLKGGKGMKLIKIISKSKNKNRMEIIAKDGKIQKTLHIHQENDTWRYFAGCDNKGNKIFFPITI